MIFQMHFVFVVFFIISQTSILTNSTISSLLISFYYESLCDDCHVFIEKQLKPIVQKLGPLVTVDLVVYGNSVWHPESNKITCQHGPKECVGNLIQACLIEDGNTLQSMDFILCMSKQTNPINTSFAARKCAYEMHIDWNSLNVCAQGPKGKNIIAKNRQKTESLVPPHKHVPWITVNGLQTSSMENNLFSVLCQSYLDPMLPQCKL